MANASKTARQSHFPETPSKQVYEPKHYNLNGLNGISDRTLEMHFKLYEGYVNETNKLTERIADFLRDGQVDQEEMPAYSELTRRWVSSTTAWCCTSTTSAI